LENIITEIYKANRQEAPADTAAAD
jgi:hypothetical protein